MRTFDLRVVQRGLKKQLEASLEVYSVIDQLQSIRDRVPEEFRLEIDQIISRLGVVGSRIVDSAGDVNDDLQKFIA